jgi:hypothetical protein
VVRACSTNGGEDECIRYWWQRQMERNHQENQDVGLCDMDWIDWLRIETSGGFL